MRKTLEAVALAMLLLASASPAAAITYGTPTGDATHRNVGAMVAVSRAEPHAEITTCTGVLNEHLVVLRLAPLATAVSRFRQLRGAPAGLGALR